MALNEIAVADIRKGQTILVVYDRDAPYGASPDSTTYIAAGDGHTNGWGKEELFYLLADIPTPPPFEVPWGTVQRDAEGRIWDFFGQADDLGYAGRADGKLLDIYSVPAYAPFIRLYTVQELANRLSEVDGIWSSAERRLRELHSRGDI